MSKDNVLRRNTDERIRATIDGEPDGAWDGLTDADFWWVLSTQPGGGEVALKKGDADDAVSVVETGGGADPAVVTIDVTDEETGSLEQDAYYQSVVVRDVEGLLSAEPLEPQQLRIRDSLADEVTSA